MKLLSKLILSIDNIHEKALSCSIKVRVDNLEDINQDNILKQKQEDNSYPKDSNEYDYKPNECYQKLELIKATSEALQKIYDLISIEKKIN